MSRLSPARQGGGTHEWSVMQVAACTARIDGEQLGGVGVRRCRVRLTCSTCTRPVTLVSGSTRTYGRFGKGGLVLGADEIINHIIYYRWSSFYGFFFGSIFFSWIFFSFFFLIHPFVQSLTQLTAPYVTPSCTDFTVDSIRPLHL